MPNNKKIFIILAVILIIAIVSVAILILFYERPKTAETNNAPQNAETGNEPAGEMANFSGEIKEFSIIAKQWEFNPSTITVNESDKVRIKITSADVPHGFALPDFKINENVNPGEETIVEFIADKKGTFTFFCSVYCGAGHKNMRGTFIVR